MTKSLYRPEFECYQPRNFMEKIPTVTTRKIPENGVRGGTFTMHFKSGEVWLLWISSRSKFKAQSYPNITLQPALENSFLGKDTQSIHAERMFSLIQYTSKSETDHNQQADMITD